MADEKRLIYADDAMKWIRESKVPETGAFTKGINKGLNIALSTLGNNEVLPTVDAVEVVHGRWIHVPSSDMMTGKAYKCSECNKMRYGSYMPNYCQCCGAKMDGGNEDD